MKQIDVVGLGVSTVEVVSLVDHFPASEEVQRAIDMVVDGGGPIATAMVTLARLGARVAMLDSIGDDWRGALIREEFQRAGVMTEHIKQNVGCTSSTACVLVRKHDGHRTIVYSPGTAPELSPMDMPRMRVESAKILHVNGRHWDACLQAVRWARDTGVQVSFDGGADRYRPEMRQLVPLTDICIVAHDFAAKYTQESDIQKAAGVLLENGPKLVVITHGAEGSWIFPRAGRSFHQHAFLLPDAVDTISCGDSYHGAFLFDLVREMGLEKAAALASAAAALNSQALGGRRGIPTLEEAEAFLART